MAIITAAILPPWRATKPSCRVDISAPSSPSYGDLQLYCATLCWLHHRHSFHTIGLSKIYLSQAAFHLKDGPPASNQADSRISLYLHLMGMDGESCLSTKDHRSEVSSSCLLIHVVSDGTNHLSFPFVVSKWQSHRANRSRRVQYAGERSEIQQFGLRGG